MLRRTWACPLALSCSIFGITLKRPKQPIWVAGIVQALSIDPLPQRETGKPA